MDWSQKGSNQNVQGIRDAEGVTGAVCNDTCPGELSMESRVGNSNGEPSNTSHIPNIDENWGIRYNVTEQPI